MHFAEKCIIFVLAKRREPVSTGFSPLFSYENSQKSGCSTKHIEKFIYRSENFLPESGFPLGEVGAQIDDIERPKVKRYLFFNPAFFTFQGRFYQLACDVSAAIVPLVFGFHKGA